MQTQRTEKGMNKESIVSELVRTHVLVKGRVQGVYYRASTREQALALGLTGWVRNLPDGRVEFEAQGRTSQVEQLITWAKQGPDHARVDELTQNRISTIAGEQSFQITR